MKKIILTLSAIATLASADNTTINATMNLMEKGMNTIQKGFLYNQKATILEGVEIVMDANNIFEKVDTKSFTNGSNATQVISNIHGNLASDAKDLKKAISDNKFANATKIYGEMVNDCVACHTVIRKW